jgi:hypothetical protein
MDDLNGQTAPESTRGLFDHPADVKVSMLDIEPTIFILSLNSIPCPWDLQRHYAKHGKFDPHLHRLILFPFFLSIAPFTSY